MVDVGGTTRTAFAVRGGVIQGCPMSATLFSFAFEPFLYALYTLVDTVGAGLSRACADDVACLLKKIRHLRQVFAVFRSAAIIVNLCLQPTKCVLIPLGRRCDLATVAMMKQFLAEIVPQWAQFQISGTGVYLGVQIGPAAHGVSWTATLTKLLNRTGAIARGRHSPAVVASLFMRSAIPMVHHVAQVCMPPPAAARLDLRLPARVLHLPGSPTPTKLLMRLPELSGPRTPSVVASMIAAYVRYSLSVGSDLGGALMCFEDDIDSLPLAWRPFDSLRHGAGPCMAGALKRTAEGDVALWPRALQPAVLVAVAAARAALDEGRSRSLQAAAYAAAHARLFAGDLNALLAPRLAKQLSIPPVHPLIAIMLCDFRSLGSRASFLAIRGATHSVCTGARLQVPDATCCFCGDAPDSLSHYATCTSALGIFCRALQRPVAPSLFVVLDTTHASAAKVWAAFVDFVSVAIATRHDVVARGTVFLEIAACALTRAHLVAPVDDGDGAGPRPPPPRRHRARAR